jgi:hypothetical protein
MMEHRLFERRPTRVGAIVENEAVGRRRVRTRDLGPGGAFLEMHPPLAPRNSPLKLAVAGRAGNVRHLFRVTAWVVRIDERGIGVEFDDGDAGVCQAAFRLLNRPSDATRSRRTAPGRKDAGPPPLSTAR